MQWQHEVFRFTPTQEKAQAQICSHINDNLHEWIDSAKRTYYAVNTFAKKTIHNSWHF